jgi:LacI family transcriptional regulator
VSRVLNHESNVRPETREQVLRVVAELKYRPKLSARSLAGARSFVIGMLYYDPSAAFVAGMQRGATQRCRESGYHLVVESFEPDARDIAAQLDHMLGALQPDGMILTPPICDNAEVLAAIEASGTPCVLVSPGERGRHVPQVRLDEVRAAEELTTLLLELGHRRIAFVKGPAEQAASAWRLKGFTKAMRAHGLKVEEQYVSEGDFTFPSGVSAAERLLSRRVPPTAVFASNDDMALGIIATAERMGLKVPDDLSVVGFDDAPAANLVWPPLTTVRQPLFDMAVAAVEMLLSRVSPQATATETAPLRVLPHEIVLRSSAAPPRSRKVREAG